MSRTYSSIAVLATCLLGLVPATARADQLTVYVPGMSDPYLSGMPAGSTASGYTPGSPGVDVAPGQSSVLVSGLPITSGMTLTFNATGSAAYGPAPASGPDFKWSGPDGMLYNGQFIHHLAGPQNGMSDIWSPINALLGVFLDNNRPDTKTSPAMLDFRAGAGIPGGTGYATLNPALGQVFFIGDGLDALAAQQHVIAPSGATRFFLGVADGYEWNNNRGGYEVRVNFDSTGAIPASVPEPGTLTLLGIGFLGLAGYLVRRRRQLHAATVPG